MARMTATVAVLLALSTGAIGATTARSGVPYLRLAPSETVTVLGYRFLPGERVRITVKVRASRARTVSAGGAGSFRAAFTGMRRNRCQPMVVVAAGSRGSRAMLRLQAPACQDD